MTDVLILTHSKDNSCVDTVTTAVQRRGGRVVRMDTDQLPTAVRFASRRGPGGTRCELHATGDLVLDADTAIWHRRIAFGDAIPRTMPHQVRAACVQETRRAFLGALTAHEGFVLDPEHRIRRAESKDLQLRLAERIGLAVPRTLVSNDPEAVRAFAAECGGNLITKMQAAFAIYEDGKENVVFTNPVSAADLADLDGLRYCPMVFQERVAKALELRVTIVGERVFTAAIDSQRHERGQADWRRVGARTVDEWRPFDLPADVQRQMLALVDELQLNYGAADLILTPDDRFVFLEINPSGEFFWLDHGPNHPISAALADVLLGKVRRRG